MEKRGERIMPKKLSKKKLRYLIKDEKKASKEYKKLGLKSIAKDESKHSRILSRKLKKK
jgi:hypothetical protein